MPRAFDEAGVSLSKRRPTLDDRLGGGMRPTVQTEKPRKPSERSFRGLLVRPYKSLSFKAKQSISPFDPSVKRFFRWFEIRVVSLYSVHVN